MNTRARRLSSTFRFVFGPLRRAGNVLSWWSTALAVVAAAPAVVGLSLPRHVGGLWIAIGGLAEHLHVLDVPTPVPADDEA